MIESLRGGALAPELRADVCVVGAGAAGVTLALELARRARRVVLLESGGPTLEPETQLLNAGQSIGHEFGLEDGRYRVLGGATTMWTGRCAKLDPIDFEERPWVPHSGWPIAFEEVEKHYAQAAIYCGISAPWRSDETARAALGLQKPDFDPAQLAPFLWRYQPLGATRRYRDWGRDYHDDLRRSALIRVVTHANAVGFAGPESGARIDSIEALALDGSRMRVIAEDFVLCCGGAENARLLLHGAEQAPHLFAGKTENAGRFFMQHPRGSIGHVETDAAGAARLQDLFNVFTRRSGAQYELGIALGEEIQRRERLVNASVILTYEADPDSPWERFKRALRERDAGAALRLSVQAGVARNLWRRGALGRHPLLEPRRIDAIIDLEQAPDRESRVMLGAERDALGMRRLVADWRIGRAERATAARFALLLGEEFARLKLGLFKPADWAAGQGAMPAEALAGTYHFIGTTRMSANAHSGVTDAEARVHGLQNLYVQGCSLFPTGGHANPTLSIVALALRQAEILTRAS